MKIHEVKIYESYADAVLSGEKTFEIRNNDRGYWNTKSGMRGC